MADYLVTDTELTSIANAIRTKGGTSASLAFPSDFISAIGAIQTEPVDVEEKAVNFYDYDGTRLYSYSASDFASLSAMPSNPTHTGLTAQGWNWTLANAKTYVSNIGSLNIGQMYTTSDGKTRVYIYLLKGRTSPMLGCCPNGSVDVDWGDGTAHDTLTGTSLTTVKWTPTHNYAAAGDYVIKLTVTGSMALYGSYTNDMYSGLIRYTSGQDKRNECYGNAVWKVEIGNGVTSIGNYAFYYSNALESITIPNSVTSIETYAFSNCTGLTSITIPNSVTSISANMFMSAGHLVSIMIPNSVTTIGTNAFQNARFLSAMTIPSGVTVLNKGTHYGNARLTSATIPSNITSIGATAFQYCSGLTELHFKRATPPTASASTTFASLPVDCTIYVPTGKLSAYKSASNYPDSNTYTYVEE